jgi:hypothetical protein
VSWVIERHKEEITHCIQVSPPTMSPKRGAVFLILHGEHRLEQGYPSSPGTERTSPRENAASGSSVEQKPSKLSSTYEGHRGSSLSAALAFAVLMASAVHSTSKCLWARWHVYLSYKECEDVELKSKYLEFLILTSQSILSESLVINTETVLNIKRNHISVL